MIDTEALRKKVIDLAIQGKLTEQLPSDGDAETLYAQILDHKSQLIKEGKIKKEKPLPDIAADEIPFEIPKNWKWVRIASVGLTVTGTTPPKENKEYYDGEYPFFKPSDLDAGRHISDGSESLTNEGWKVSRQLRKGSILVCCIGTIGKSAIIDVDGTTNQQINAITPILCDSDYLLYAIESDSFQKQLQQGARATTVTIIKKSKFDECIIPLPALSEQKRIADKLEEVLAQIDIIDDLQAKYSNDLAVLKSKIIDAGIQGKLTEQLLEDGDAEDLYAQIMNQKSQLIKEGKIKKEKPLLDIAADEIPFEIPKNWKWVRLGELIKINSGTGLTSYQMGKGDIPVYGGNGVTGYHDESLVNEETIVIGRVGFYCGSVHVTPEKAWVTDNAFITQYPKNLINRDFLVYALRNMNLGQNTNGAAQPVVSGKKIYPLLFALPPFDEQKRIAKRIDDVLTIVDSLQ